MDKELITSILEASKGTGIKKIKYQDLVLEFYDLTPENNYSNTNNTGFVLKNFSHNEQEATPAQEVPLTKEELSIREEFESAYEAAMYPEAYEKRMTERNLNAE